MNRASLWPPILKSLVFIVVTVLATGVLLTTISQTSGGGRELRAVFTDVTSLQDGDDVRIAGVKVGSVASIAVQDRTQAVVTMAIDTDVDVAASVTAAIRFRNLVGQRYISLDQGDAAPNQTWPAGQTLGTDRTSPALDLTTLFDGFQPLFKALSPGEVNTLSNAVVQIFQGEGGTIDSLLTQTASLTSTLADRDQVIGEVIDNLTSVLQTVDAHGQGLRDTISTLSTLVQGLAADRDAIGSAVSGIGSLTTSVSGLLEQGRPGLQASIDSLGALSANLNAGEPLLQNFLSTLPTKLTAIGRTASYGSWVNFYVCEIGEVPANLIPAASTDDGETTGSTYYGPNSDPTQVATPDQTGVNPLADRCLS